MKKEAKKEEPKEWKPTGRKLEGKELEEYYQGFKGIEESIDELYKDKKNEK